MQNGWPVRRLFDVPIHALTMDQVLAVVNTAVQTRQQLLVGVVNAAKMVNMRRNPALGEAVLGADLILADGMSVVWACRVLGRPLPERVPGIDLMDRLLEEGRHRGYRVYCLGATAEVLDAAIAKMEVDHPGVQIVGRQHGYFKPAEEEAVAQRIAEARPDILFVAMTSPKKEEFLGRWSRVMGVPVCHGVGGSFDVLAGKVKRAPAIWQRFGMEWLYRVVQEPRRMWRRYAVTNTLFCGMVFSEMLSRFRSRPQAQ